MQFKNFYRCFGPKCVDSFFSNNIYIYIYMYIYIYVLYIYILFQKFKIINCILLVSPEQDVLICLVINRFSRNVQTFCYKNYAWRLDIVQNLCVLRQFFFPDFLSPKCFNTPKPKIPLGYKMFNTSNLYTTLVSCWSHSKRQTVNLIHGPLTFTSEHNVVRRIPKCTFKISWTIIIYIL